MNNKIDWVKESGLSQLEINNLDKADYDLCKSIHDEEEKLLSKVDTVYDERIAELEKRKEAITYQIRMQYQDKIVQCVRASISISLIKGILGDNVTNSRAINNIISDSLSEIHKNYKNKHQKSFEDYGLYSNKQNTSLSSSEDERIGASKKPRTNDVVRNRSFRDGRGGETNNSHHKRRNIHSFSGTSNNNNNNNTGNRKCKKENENGSGINRRVGIIKTSTSVSPIADISHNLHDEQNRIINPKSARLMFAPAHKNTASSGRFQVSQPSPPSKKTSKIQISTASSGSKKRSNLHSFLTTALGAPVETKSMNRNSNGKNKYPNQITNQGNNININISGNKNHSSRIRNGIISTQQRKQQQQRLHATLPGMLQIHPNHDIRRGQLQSRSQLGINSHNDGRNIGNNININNRLQRVQRFNQENQQMGGNPRSRQPLNTAKPSKSNIKKQVIMTRDVPSQNKNLLKSKPIGDTLMSNTNENSDLSIKPTLAGQNSSNTDATCGNIKVVKNHLIPSGCRGKVSIPSMSPNCTFSSISSPLHHDQNVHENMINKMNKNIDNINSNNFLTAGGSSAKRRVESQEEKIKVKKQGDVLNHTRQNPDSNHNSNNYNNNNNNQTRKAANISHDILMCHKEKMDNNTNTKNDKTNISTTTKNMKNNKSGNNSNGNGMNGVSNKMHINIPHHIGDFLLKTTLSNSSKKNSNKNEEEPTKLSQVSGFDNVCNTNTFQSSKNSTSTDKTKSKRDDDDSDISEKIAQTQSNGKGIELKKHFGKKMQKKHSGKGSDGNDVTVSENTKIHDEKKVNSKNSERSTDNKNKCINENSKMTNLRNKNDGIGTSKISNEMNNCLSSDSSSDYSDLSTDGFSDNSNGGGDGNHGEGDKTNHRQSVNSRRSRSNDKFSDSMSYDNDYYSDSSSDYSYSNSNSDSNSNCRSDVNESESNWLPDDKNIRTKINDNKNYGRKEKERKRLKENGNSRRHKRERSSDYQHDESKRHRHDRHKRSRRTGGCSSRKYGKRGRSGSHGDKHNTMSSNKSKNGGNGNSKTNSNGTGGKRTGKHTNKKRKRSPVDEEMENGVLLQNATVIDVNINGKSVNGSDDVDCDSKSSNKGKDKENDNDKAKDKDKERNDVYRNNLGREWKCKLCNKKLFGRKSMITHLKKIHKNDKPYKCNLCLKSFGQACSFRRHLRTHTGEKPFECNICKHKFSTRANKNRHMRIHTGEMPFDCNDCNLKFRYHSTMKSHMKSVHGQ